MIVSIYNKSSASVYISSLCKSLAPAEAISFVRTQSDIDTDVQLKSLISNGQLTISFQREDTDNVSTGLDDEDVIDYAPKLIIIYVRNNGNDSTGDGSKDNPYRTTPRAVRDVPPFGNDWYKIDTTGVTETLPPNWTIPPLASTVSAVTNSENITMVADFYWYPIMFVADMTRLVTLDSSAIVSQISDSIDQLIRVTFSGVSWTSSAYKGKILASSSFNTSVIADNGTNWVDICTSNPFSGDTIYIQDYSWNVTYTEDGSYNPGIDTPGLDAPLLVYGMKLTRPAMPLSTFGIQISSIPGAIFWNCDLDGVSQQPVAGQNTTIFACVVRNYLYMVGGAPYCDNSLFLNVSMHIYGDGGRGEFFYNQCTFDHCDSIGHTGNSEVEATYQFQFIRVKNAFSYALVCKGGSCSAYNMKLVNCALGIVVYRPCYLELFTVGGDSPLSGVGLLMDDGAHVRIDSTYALTSSAGDFKVGKLAPRSLVDFRSVSPSSGRPQFNEYDGDAMNGTGTRLWE